MRRRLAIGVDRPHCRKPGRLLGGAGGINPTRPKPRARSSAALCRPICSAAAAAGPPCAGPICPAGAATSSSKPGTPGCAAASARRAQQAQLCAEARPLAIATPEEQRAWIERRFQPYRVVEPNGSAPDGLLTGYYEPIMAASRVPTATHRTPLHAPPAGLVKGQTWYTRKDIDTLPAAQAALQGKAIAWMADPIDALILQIQGSGRLRITEPDGRQRQVRLAFAGHNGQPYQSVGRWLLDQRAIREASWESIKAWAAATRRAATTCSGATRAPCSSAKKR